MMNKRREHVALSAYLNLLERKGFTKIELRQREVIILSLSHGLKKFIVMAMLLGMR
jgi:hypothetical protein